MKIPKASIRTTWRADWLLEFSATLVLLGILTREIAFASVGIGTLLALSVLGLIFHRKLGILQKHLHVVQRLSRTKVLLGDSVEGELTIRNGSPLTAQILGAQPDAEKVLAFELRSSFSPVLGPGTTTSTEFSIIPLAKGRFQISGFILTLIDARGLFTEKVRCGQADWVEVSPGIATQVPMTPLRLYGESPEILRTVHTGTEYAGIREYAPGDEYHRIEWKATARLRTLMVKEFHPETGGALQILIDAGRTMCQQSYLATKLDEAVAVAQLLTESVVGSGNRVGIWVYDETEIVRAIKPAIAEEQQLNLRELALTLRTQAANEESVTRVPRLRASWPGKPNLPSGKRAAPFLRLLRPKLRFGYQKTGIYKALTEATRTDRDGFIVVLTDFQTSSDAFLDAASTRREPGRIVVAQIGAPWRWSSGLEEGYIEHQKNDRTLKSLRRIGLAVFDVRPEGLIEMIFKETRKRTRIAGARLP